METLDLLFGADGWAGLILKGAAITLTLAIASLPLGFGLGLLLALMKTSRRRIVRALAETYTTLLRGIPDLLTLFILYFGAQALIDKLARALGLSAPDIDAFWTASVALGLVVAAYSSEVWTGALVSVQPGQREAAAALGLSKARAFALVVFPQLIRIALPGLGNNWMILLKETSLVSALAVGDVLRSAFEASKTTNRPMLFFAIAALVYLVFSLVSMAVLSVLEQRANRGYGLHP